ncbi:MAG: IclR family transcriptional regulator [Betaproteobacteria bacterium]
MKPAAPAADAAAPERSGTTAGRTVQSLERAFAILEAIAGSDEPSSLVDLSRSTGLHTSTAFHLLKTLMVLGYVRQDEARRYRIGARLFMQAASAFTEVELVNLATPHLKRLADETGETTHLAVKADHGIAVIAKVDARSSIRASERIGIIRPAHCTAIGKVLLATLPDAELESYLSGAPFDAYTPKTLTDATSLRDEIRRIAVSGTAYDDTEFNLEVRCVAAPVGNYLRQTVAAMGMSGPGWRVTPRELPRLAALVAAAAADLSRDLGFRPAPAQARAVATRK